MSDLDERVARLERSIRRWRQVMAGAVLVALLAFGASVARTEIDHALVEPVAQTVVRAKRFELVGGAGMARATLSFDDSRFVTVRMIREDGSWVIADLGIDGVTVRERGTNGN